MKKMTFLFFRVLLWFVGIIVIYIIGTLTYGTFFDFQPEKIITLENSQKAKLAVIEDSTLTFTTWNLGYGGLGAEANFFFDSEGMLRSNGKMIRPSKELVDKYVAGMAAFVKENPTDFMLFQEVDFHSKRSYYSNQFDVVSNILSDYSAIYAVNYKSDWVPIPTLEPWRAYGEVDSGLGSWSKYEPIKSTRYQLPGDFPWPTRIFQLDRCAAVQRFSVKGGKELIVINVHNSAYDKGGKLKAEQMAFLHDFFLKEYDNGNYVIVGGDWNQCPPGLQFDKLMPGKTSGYSQTNIAPDYLPTGWTWAFDDKVATNRKVRDIYKEGKTFITVIDFFLLSPNVELRSVKGYDLNFQFSDHQPVIMEVKLK